MFLRDRTWEELDWDGLSDLNDKTITISDVYPSDLNTWNLDDCELKKLWEIVEKWNNEHRYHIVFGTPPVSDFELWKANSYVSFQSEANGQQDRSLIKLKSINFWLRQEP